MRIIFAVLAVFVLILFVDARDAQARPLASYCERAQNTADIMACVKKRHDEAQKRLTIVFDQILKNEDKALSLVESARATEDVEGNISTEELEVSNFQGRASMVRNAQKNWIAYRDQECEWEKTLEGTESLKRIRHLSCITALTEHRLEVLGLALDREDGGSASSAEYRATPRWMNALASDRPNVYWQYNDHLRADLDCNGTDDEIMSGVHIKARGSSAAAEGELSVQAIVAITDNSATGRPKATLFDFSVLPEGGAGQLCSSNVKLSLVNYAPSSQPLPDEGAPSSVKACAVALQIDDHKCAPKLVHWSGDRYEVISIAAP